MSTDLIEARVSKLSTLCKQYVGRALQEKEEAENISQALVNARNKRVHGEDRLMRTSSRSPPPSCGHYNLRFRGFSLLWTNLLGPRAKQYNTPSATTWTGWN